jgi:hypothetical protein
VGGRSPENMPTRAGATHVGSRSHRWKVGPELWRCTLAAATHVGPRSHRCRVVVATCSAEASALTLDRVALAIGVVVDVIVNADAAWIRRRFVAIAHRLREPSRSPKDPQYRQKFE